MAQDVTIAGASFTAVPAIAVPKTGGGIADFFDLTGDTITAAGLLKTMTAHNGLGEPITGTLIDGVTRYYYNTFTYELQNLHDKVFSLGFVPRFFLLFNNGSSFTVPDYIRTLALFYSVGMKMADGTSTNDRRGLYSSSSGSSKYILSYSDISCLPYENGSTKGVIGDCSGSSNPGNYKLYGSYRLIAIA